MSPFLLCSVNVNLYFGFGINIYQINSLKNRGKKNQTLTFDGSMGMASPVRALGSSSTAQRAVTTSEAVWTQRRNGDTKTRWIGNPRPWRIFQPVFWDRTRPSWHSGGSQGRFAVDTHKGSKLSIRSPCLITTTFW